MKAKLITLDAKDRQRLAKACMELGIKFPEFCVTAIRHALDEFEGNET